MANRVNLYEHLDYRDFLKAYYVCQKANQKGFSYRLMAKKMGFTSPNYLKLIIDKDREIGKSSVQKIIDGLPLKKREAEYFSHLVSFAKAKTTAEKNWLYTLISSMRTKQNITRLQPDQFEYYSNWYNIVIRALIHNEPVDLNYTELANKIYPSVLPKQVKKSVFLLEKLKLIRRTKDGDFVLSSALINTQNEVESLLIKNFHHKMIELAAEALEKVPSEKREIACCTIKISKKGFDKIKSRIHRMREEILQIAKDDTDVDRIAQVNFQLFPLSKNGL